MKTCVINVYQKRVGVLLTEYGKPLETEWDADDEAVLCSSRARVPLGSLSIGKTLRSAGVAYRLRVTMKD